MSIKKTAFYLLVLLPMLYFSMGQQRIFAKVMQAAIQAIGISQENLALALQYKHCHHLFIAALMHKGVYRLELQMISSACPTDCDRNRSASRTQVQPDFCGQGKYRANANQRVDERAIYILSWIFIIVLMYTNIVECDRVSRMGDRVGVQFDMPMGDGRPRPIFIGRYKQNRA